MKISLIQYLKSAYRASRSNKKISQLGYSSNYFMQKSPLSEGYKQPSRMAKICQNIRNFFVNFFDN